MSFTYDLTTSRGMVRLQVSDTNSAAYAFEDAEIDYFLSKGGSVNGGTVEALRVLYIDASKRAKAFSLPGVSYNDTSRLAGIKEALKMYGGEMPTISTLRVTRLPMDTGHYEQPVIFSTSSS